jgi:hypothetical protein
VRSDAAPRCCTDTNVLSTDGNFTLDEERWVDWDVPTLD